MSHFLINAWMITTFSLRDCHPTGSVAEQSRGHNFLHAAQLQIAATVRPALLTAQSLRKTQSRKAVQAGMRLKRESRARNLLSSSKK